MVTTYENTERFLESIKNKKRFTKQFKEKMKKYGYGVTDIDYDGSSFYELMEETEEFQDFIEDTKIEKNLDIDVREDIGYIGFLLEYCTPQDLYRFLKIYFDSNDEYEYEKRWEKRDFSLEEMKFWLRGYRSFSFTDPLIIKYFKEKMFWIKKDKYLIRELAKWYDYFGEDEMVLFWKNNIIDIGKARKLKENGITYKWLEFGIIDYRKVNKLKLIMKDSNLANWDLEGRLPSEYGLWKELGFSLDEMIKWKKEPYLVNIEPNEVLEFKKLRISSGTVSNFYKINIKDPNKIYDEIKKEKKEKSSKTRSIMKDMKLKREIFDYICGIFVIDTRNLADSFDIDIRTMYRLCYDLEKHDLIYSERQVKDSYGSLRTVIDEGAKSLSVAWLSPYEDNSASPEEQDEAFFKAYGTYGKDDK